jgi:Golgi SNAP receptor complex protein 1
VISLLFPIPRSPSVPARPAAEGNSKAWEELRREVSCAANGLTLTNFTFPDISRPPPLLQARKLEGELDVKIAAYGKLCSSFEYGYTKGEAGLSTDAALQAKTSEIDTALSRLSDVNASMGHALSGGSDSRTHTLARHRDILHDLTQEYRRLASILGAARDRADLIGGAGDASAPLLPGSGSTGLLLRERATLDRSNTAIDSVIAQATGVASTLTNQRALFDAIDSKVASIGARYPVVNSLLNAIRRRKNRDNLILAGVAGVCLLLILLYWVNK